MMQQRTGHRLYGCISMPFLFAALTITVPLFLPETSSAQQNNAKIFGGEIQTGKTEKMPTGRFYYPDRLLVTFKKGVNASGVITGIIRERKESSAGQADLQVKLHMTNKQFGLVSIQPPKIEKELFGTRPVMVREDLTKENSLQTAVRSDDWLLARLRASDEIADVSRDYVLFAYDSYTDSINNIISGQPELPGARPTTPAKPKHPPAATALYPNDSLYKLQWHLKLYGERQTATTSPGASGFPLLWRSKPTKNPPVIAVIDTGLYYDHEDIKGNKRILPGFDFISNPRTAKDGDGIDNDPTDPGTGSPAGTCPGRGVHRDSWHGTHVAGLAGAVGSNNGRGTTGGSWYARIVPVRVLGRCDSGSNFDIARAMLWAGGISLAGVPDNLNPASIINLSLGGTGPCSALMQNVIDALVRRGVTIVVAAGNSAIDARKAFPAGCRNVITVAAGDARGHIAPYSNFGPRVDLMAAGGNLRRDDNGDRFADGLLSAFKGGYKFYQGTSQATPMVAAAAALIKTRHPSYGPKKILEVLKKTARPRTGQQCPKGCGSGLLNLAPLAAESAAQAANRY